MMLLTCILLGRKLIWFDPIWVPGYKSRLETVDTEIDAVLALFIGLFSE